MLSLLGRVKGLSESRDDLREEEKNQQQQPRQPASPTTTTTTTTKATATATTACFADLDTVEDGAHDAGAELDGQGLSATKDRVADGQAGGVLVHLNKGGKKKRKNEQTNRQQTT